MCSHVPVQLAHARGILLLAQQPQRNNNRPQPEAEPRISLRQTHLRLLSLANHRRVLQVRYCVVVVASIHPQIPGTAVVVTCYVLLASRASMAIVRVLLTLRFDHDCPGRNA